MKIPQPVYIAPILLEQPTWGGSYIATVKKITDTTVASLRIGQSYELAAECLTYEEAWQAAFQLGREGSLENLESFAIPEAAITFEERIAQNKVAWLGGEIEVPLLIKFTQARKNSYQLHVSQDKQIDDWLAKPESWYFFEAGLATLGINLETNIKAYQQRCQEIYDFAQKLSQEIKTGSKSLATAKNELTTFIEKDHPRNYVNTVNIPANTVIDLSAGGIHHSWEVSDDLPEGNIVYELQRDVKDDVSTLRSFDQGKIKDDGSIRPLTIDEYFQALKTDHDTNTPENYLTKGTVISQEGKSTITSIFDNPYYQLTQIDLQGHYQGPATTPQTLHHLFVKQGSVTIETADGNWPLTQGWSLAIPAATKDYIIHTSEPSTVLISSPRLSA